MMAEGEVYEIVLQQLGGGAAETLARHFGGRTLYIPGAADPQHVVARQVSLDVLTVLVEHFGRDVVYVPFGPTAPAAQRRAAVATALSAGASSNDAARLAGVSIATVKRVRRAQRHLKTV